MSEKTRKTSEVCKKPVLQNKTGGCLIFHTKFQPNIPSCSGENDDFISWAIFSNGGPLEFSIRLNFTILKPWSLIKPHMKSKIHGCSGLRD